MALRVGLQMYSVRTEMAIDPVATTAAVAKMGYKFLEYANLTATQDFGCGFGTEAEELRGTLDSLGAKPLGVHSWPLNDTNIDQIIAYHQRLGTRYIVSKMIPEHGETLEEMAASLARIGGKVHDAGLEHLIHSSLMRHAGDTTDLDIILDSVDESLVNVELDTYWAYRSGLDPVWVMRRYGERIKVLHQKDAPATMEQPVNIVEAVPEGQPLGLDVYWDKHVAPQNFVEIGTGVLPVQDYIDAALKYTGAEYILLEQDFTTLPELESVAISLANLRQTTGLTWD